MAISDHTSLQVTRNGAVRILHFSLQHAHNMLVGCGGTLTHADLTIICEAPKIGPHRDAIRTRIADILGISSERISVKATTTEGLGFTGRSEGIAAQATVTISVSTR